MLMKKAEAQALAKRHGLEILRNPITREAHGLWTETERSIPELDQLAETPYHDRDNVYVNREYFGSEWIRYTVFCPRKWFDLWGWAD